MSLYVWKIRPRDQTERDSDAKAEESDDSDGAWKSEEESDEAGYFAADRVYDHRAEG